ncbi:MAG: ABC transporter permease [Rectinema subterraneum]|uniref:ABC transporter permease n=1 Tax=Rectinema subterraneum TaxID=2653714 RepID=UPI003C7E3032
MSVSAPRRTRMVLKALSLILAVPGVLLYLASYFWGAWLLLCAIALYAADRFLAVGSAVFGSEARKLFSRAIVPVAGIGSALLIGAVIMAITGYNPISSYGALFYGGLVRNWHISVLNATPLIFTGLAIAFAFQGGFFNIGAEGQYYIGVIAATWMGLGSTLPGIIAIPAIFAVAAIAGAALNAIPIILKVKTGAHEVVTTMMFAYVVRTLSPMFIRAHGGDPALTSHPYTTDLISESVWLPMFKDFLPGANYRLHIGVLLAIGAAFLVRFILMKTDLGYKIRAVGHNPVAAMTQGISVARITAASLFISGSLAAIAGATQVLGLDHRMFQDLNAGYGWNGISIALLARNNPIGIIFTSLLWGVLDAGGQYMARTTQTPNAIIEIVKGIILFLMLAEVIYKRAGSVFGRWAGRFKTAARKGAGA